MPSTYSAYTITTVELSKDGKSKYKGVLYGSSLDEVLEIMETLKTIDKDMTVVITTTTIFDGYSDSRENVDAITIADILEKVRESAIKKKGKGLRRTASYEQNKD